MTPLAAPTATVRDACFDVMRAEAMTTIFSNPGSTEIPFLSDLPGEFRFVLALHEGSVVGIASGFALGTAQPAFVLLHTTAGLGNAVSAIATARVNHAPMVIVVGQQDRRHLALASADSPVIVAGSGNDSQAGWAALTELAERLNAPVWQEPFGSRAGFPQDHSLYRGQLPADRPRLRDTLCDHDLLLVVGTAALRQYPYRPGPLVPDGIRTFVLTADPAEAHRSPAELAIIGDPAVLCRALAAALPAPRRAASATAPQSSYRLVASGDGPLRAAHVFQLLADRLPPETTIVEESPSSRPALESLIPARRPFAFLSAAMGGLGFAMPAAIGLKLGRPRHPVLAIIGDGSSMYSIQSLWTAANLGVGTLFIVLNNGGYAVMNRLAEQRGGRAPWPAFGNLSVSVVARGLGVEARVIEGYADLAAVVDEVLASLADRTSPLVLEVVVAPDEAFAP